MSKIVNINSNEPYDVYIGRGTKWGNPFTHRGGTSAIVKVSSREEAIECYKNYIEATPVLLQAAKKELKGKTLGCHCVPLPCHGEVLLKIANEDAMIFDELVSRGLVKQCTNTEQVKQLLDHSSIRFYIGFDPTADSLHVGHLLQLITAKRLLETGHEPLMLIGSATASIGDPTGKSEMRKTLKTSRTMENADKITKQIESVLRNVNTINNMSWFEDMNFMEFISNIGKHFSVNQMLKADCFQSRMENGLSFLEFNYMLMQGFDFLHLFQFEEVVLQIGGDDQWSNILAGIDLIHKKTHKEAFGLTITLLTNSQGQKMGKTEKGAIWLDETKTSVFDFFQFWRNMPDEEVMKCFKLLTFLSLEEIGQIPFATVMEMNEAKKKLAFEITRIVHGEEKAITALRQAKALFEENSFSGMESISIGRGASILDLIIKCNFAQSKTAARQLINGKGIAINEEIVIDPTLKMDSFDKEIILRRGKKNFCRIIIED